jgi:hypothetical protein
MRTLVETDIEFHCYPKWGNDRDLHIAASGLQWAQSANSLQSVLTTAEPDFADIGKFAKLTIGPFQ